MRAFDFRLLGDTSAEIARGLARRLRYRCECGAIRGTDEWVVEKLVRARPKVIDGAGRPTSIRFPTAEDTLLYMLVSYRLGGEQSERQWNDVLGMIKVQADRQDRAHLRHSARHLKVTELFDRTLA